MQEAVPYHSLQTGAMRISVGFKITWPIFRSFPHRASNIWRIKLTLVQIESVVRLRLELNHHTRGLCRNWAVTEPSHTSLLYQPNQTEHTHNCTLWKHSGFETLTTDSRLCFVCFDSMFLSLNIMDFISISIHR